MENPSGRAEGVDLIVLYRLVPEVVPMRVELRIEHLLDGTTETRELPGLLKPDELNELLAVHILRHKPERVFFKIDTGPAKELSAETRQRIVSGEVNPVDIYIGG